MGTFLRENWVWIAAPLILVLLLITVVIFMGGEDSPFLYNIW